MGEVTGLRFTQKMALRARSLAPPGPKRRVQIIKHCCATFDSLSIVLACDRESLDQTRDSVHLGPPELRILEVDVVDDLADGCERRIVEAGARQQHLEGAAVAVMGELTFEHVEAQLAGFRDVAPARYELESCLWVDEAS